MVVAMGMAQQCKLYKRTKKVFSEANVDTEVIQLDKPIHDCIQWAVIVLNMVNAYSRMMM